MNGLEIPNLKTESATRQEKKFAKRLFEDTSMSKLGEDEVNRRDTVSDVLELIWEMAHAVLEGVRARIHEPAVPRATMQLNYKDSGSHIPDLGQDVNEDVVQGLARVNEIKPAYEVLEPIIKVLAAKQLRGRARDWYNFTEGTIAKSRNN